MMVNAEDDTVRMENLQMPAHSGSRETVNEDQMDELKTRYESTKIPESGQKVKKTRDRARTCSGS